MILGFCRTGKGKGEGLALKQKFQGAFLQRVCITWRIASFSTCSHRRDRLLGPWTKSNRQCALQAGYLFSRLCCTVDSNSWINAVRCSLLTEGVIEGWTSAFRSIDVLQSKWLNAVLRVQGGIGKYPQTQLIYYFMGSNGLVAIVFNVLCSLFDQISIWSQLPFWVCFHIQH